MGEEKKNEFRIFATERLLYMYITWTLILDWLSPKSRKDAKYNT